MNKLAIFVEGQTEQIFIEKLIKYIAGTKALDITNTKLSGTNKKNSSRILQIQAISLENIEYYVLIVDCSHDKKVKSDICDQYKGLVNAGFKRIIGIRDAGPEAKNYLDVPRLRQGLVYNLPGGPIPICFILSIMALETWLMAEYLHFPLFHPNITVGRIKQDLDIDVVHGDLMQRIKPIEDLKNIYWLENIHYDKSKNMVINIISKLNQAFLKNEVSLKFEDLRALYQELDLFFLNHNEL